MYHAAKHHHICHIKYLVAIAEVHARAKRLFALTDVDGHCFLCRVTLRAEKELPTWPLWNMGGMTSLTRAIRH